MSHPLEWKWGGFHEIQNPRTPKPQNPKTQYNLIDHDILKRLLNIEDEDELVKIHQGWIDNQLESRPTRQEHNSKSIAVGSKTFV